VVALYVVAEKNEDLSPVDGQKFMDSWNKNQDVIFELTILVFFPRGDCVR
jgi:hypothetical protein